MNVTEDRKELFKAISAAQGEFSTVEKNAKNPHYNSKFAPLDSIIEMIRPILPKHGLSVVQFTDIPENGAGVIIETIITHESGQYISGRLQMPTVKQDPQGYGSAITYGRRYALGAALGIVSDEDVDGNQPEGKGKAQGERQKPEKSAAENQSAEISKAHTSLYMELANVCGGDEAAMDAKLKEISQFPGSTAKMTLDALKAGKPSEKWVGMTLGKLRASISAQEDQEDIPF